MRQKKNSPPWRVKIAAKSGAGNRIIKMQLVEPANQRQISGRQPAHNGTLNRVQLMLDVHEGGTDCGGVAQPGLGVGEGAVAGGEEGREFG